LKDLTLWDYDPNAIKLTPYYSKLLQWCDSVDIIRVPPYTGDPVRYPSREIDSSGSEDMSDLLVDVLMDYHVMTNSPDSTNFMKNLLSKHDYVESKVDTVKKEPNCSNTKRIGKKRVRTTIDRASSKTKKIRIDSDCEIINIEGVHGPIELSGPNIDITKLMKIGKEMHALGWDYNLGKYFIVNVVEQMLF